MPKVMPLPYVPIDPMIDESERMGLFLDALGEHADPDPEGRIYRLILWAGRSRIDGNTGDISARRLADACRWTGDALVFLDALLIAGWLVPVDVGYRIGGWSRHGGRVLKAREKFTNDKRVYRCKNKGHPPETCECPSVVLSDTPRTSQGHTQDVPKTSGGSPSAVRGMKCEVRSVKGEVLKSEGNLDLSLAAPSATPSTPKAPPVISIPLVDKTDYDIDAKQIAAWSESFPGIDVLQELRKAREWSLSNPTKRKTAKGIRRHLTAWLSSAQDKGGGGSAPIHTRPANVGYHPGSPAGDFVTGKVKI